MLLTLLSILQAIALDMLWSKSIAQMGPIELTPLYITAVLQALATLLILIMVWTSFVSLLMRFVWIPSMLDTALPFLVGILQFALIEHARPDRLGEWFILQSALILVITYVTHIYYKKARLDPENSEFFKSLSPATWRDMIPEFVWAFVAFVVGMAILMLDIDGWLKCATIVVVVSALAHFVIQQNKFWIKSFQSEGET